MVFASIRRLLASGRCAWLLAWALCLPVAEWAAAVHALQHLHAGVAEERESPGQLPLACDLDVAVAAIGAGAPLPPAQAHAPILLPQPAPRAQPVAQRRAPPTPFYSTRAPPLLHA